MKGAPQKGFGDDEFRVRAFKAQSAMGRAGLDALLLTTHPDIYYFTGFLTRFWESPTRPWFVILPQSGCADCCHSGDWSAADGVDVGE